MKFFHIFTLAFIVFQSQAQDLPSLVIELFRHGARSPSQSIDPTWKDHDELTPVGIRQHYILGILIGERYPHLFNNYNFKTVYARSSNFNRTLMSAFSQLEGIYNGKGPELPEDAVPEKMTPPFADEELINRIVNDLKETTAALPASLQLVPVHSVALETDSLLYNGPGNCPNSSNWFGQNTNNDETRIIFDSFEKTTQYLNSKGENMKQLFDYFVLGDTVIANHFANKNLYKDLIQYGDEYYNDIVHGFQWFTNYVYGGTGVQLRAFSYEKVNQIITWLENKRDGTNPHSFIMLSAHDTTLLHLLGLLNITYPECLAKNYESKKKGEEEPFPLCTYPTFASQIFIELYQPKDDEPYIKFIYNSNEIKLCNEKEKCSLQEFKQLMTELVGLTPSEYAEICSLSHNKESSGQLLKIILITIAISLLLLLGLFGAYIYLKKKQNSETGAYSKIKEISKIEVGQS